MTRSDLIAAYRKADPEQRLALFLTHPALRDEFMNIDMAEYRAVAQGTVRETDARPWWKRLIFQTQCH